MPAIFAAPKIVQHYKTIMFLKNLLGDQTNCLIGGIFNAQVKGELAGLFFASNNTGRWNREASRIGLKVSLDTTRQDRRKNQRCKLDFQHPSAPARFWQTQVSL